MMAEFLWLALATPPSSAGASSSGEKANSNYERYSAALQGQVAGPLARDGDTRHIAMKSIRMRGRESISQINTCDESNKRKL